MKKRNDREFFIESISPGLIESKVLSVIVNCWLPVLFMVPMTIWMFLAVGMRGALAAGVLIVFVVMSGQVSTNSLLQLAPRKRRFTRESMIIATVFTVILTVLFTVVYSVAGFIGWQNLLSSVSWFLAVSFLLSLSIGLSVQVEQFSEPEQQLDFIRLRNQLWFIAAAGVLCGYSASHIVEGRYLDAIKLNALFGVVPSLLNTTMMDHDVTRRLLWANKKIPMDLRGVLDDACTLILMRRQGASYVFVNGMIMDYFALDEGSLARATDSQRVLTAEDDLVESGSEHDGSHEFEAPFQGIGSEKSGDTSDDV